MHAAGRPDTFGDFILTFVNVHNQKLRSFFLFYSFELFSCLVPKSLSTTGEQLRVKQPTIQQSANLIRLGNIHLYIYVLVVCDDQTRVSGGCQWYIERRRPISFSSSTWNRIEPRNVKVLPKKFPIVVTFLSLVEFYHPISSSIYSAFVFDSCSTFVGGWVVVKIQSESDDYLVRGIYRRADILPACRLIYAHTHIIASPLGPLNKSDKRCREKS